MDLTSPTGGDAAPSISVMKCIEIYLDFGKTETEHEEALETISGEVSQKNITMQELIVSLGNQLTGDEEKLRGRATLLLAEVCNSLSVDPIAISSNSIKHLAVFFRNRLADFPSLLASMRGLEVIVTYHSDRVVPREEFIRGIFKSMSEVNVQSLSQSYRLVAYRVYLALMTNQAARECLGANTKPERGEVSAVGATSDEEDEISLDVVNSIISAVDGERDPRSLVMSLRLIAATFKHHHRSIFTFTNKFFDIIACYFPITFTPPPDDPHGITSEDLITLLEDCLCGHEALLGRLIPFMKNKLQKDIFHGKVQAMSCITRVCCEYGPSVFLQESPREIADTLYEFAQGCTSQDEEAAELANTAFRCIESLVKDISKKYVANSDEYCEEREGWNGLIEPLLKHAETAMKAPTSSITLNGKTGIQVICCVSRGSFIASKAVIERFLPLLASYLPTGSIRENHLPSLPSTLAHITLLLSSLGASGVNFSGMGTIHPVANHGPSLLRSLVSFLHREKYYVISEDTVELTGATSAVVREAISCLKELFIQIPSSDVLEVSRNEMLSLISSVTDISAYGQGALLGSRLLPADSYTDLPARTVDDDMDTEDNTDGIISRKSDEDPNECSHDHDSGRGDSCCDGSHNHGDHDSSDQLHTEGGDEDPIWTQRVQKQRLLLSSGVSCTSSSSSSNNVIDTASTLLKYSALEMLCQFSRLSSDNDAIISRVYKPVKELLLSTGNDNLNMFEQCVTILSRISNQCRFGKDNQEVFSSMIEPLITTLASVVSSGCNDENFVKKTVIILSSIKQSISNANVSAQKIKLLVTSPNLNFLTHVTNELGMIYDNGTTSSSSSSLVGVRDNDTIVSKYSELLQELVSQLSEEVLEEFQTSILKGLHNKPIQNFELLDLVSVSLTLAVLSKSSNNCKEETQLFCFVRKMAEYPPEEINLLCLKECINIIALYINKASWQLADIIAKAALESCISSMAKHFDQSDLLLVLCKYLILISRSILMRADSSIQSLPPTACDLIDSTGESRSIHLKKWHESIIAILLQSMTSCVFRNEIAMTSITLTSDMDSIFVPTKCNTTILWKQKLWTTLFLGLEEKLKETDKESNANDNDVGHLLLIMNGFIQNMPDGIVANNKDTICTLCVRAFSRSSVNEELNKFLQAIAIENVYKFIGDILKEKMKNHINTIAPACVAMAQKGPAAKLRCMALECLLKMCELYPYHKLYPVKKIILKGLQNVVDDKKRAIRILAAKVRNEYSVLTTN